MAGTGEANVPGGGATGGEADLQDRLVALGRALVDQERARIIVPANAQKPGYWFGGGNLLADADGTLHLVGRYRNAGDSRTGLGAGERGLELAIFSSRDRGATFTKTVSLSKAALSRSEGEVISIEGAALNRTQEGVELFISTEKSTREYPSELAQFQKPGTGVWTIDRLTAPDVTALAEAEVVPLLSGNGAEHLHVKDPVVHMAADGATVLIFGTNPFGWSSCNTGYCIRPSGSDRFDPPSYDLLPRGAAWDVAATRVTDVLSLDGALFGVEEPVQLVFYDGAECLRPHDENSAAASRPRGYSCEELGGLAWTTNDHLDAISRLSLLLPLFLSPYGTRSSRYVHTLATQDGIYAAWQQAQADGSQPLVMNFLDWHHVRGVTQRGDGDDANHWERTH